LISVKILLKGVAVTSVSAAPNRARIRARVDGVESVPGAPKWYWTTTILDAESITGGLFAHPGDVARVFAVGVRPPLEVGDTFTAEVEYIGGPERGEFQLHEVLEAPDHGTG
jgi:hypothetical protein